MAPSEALADELKEHVAQKIGAIARPDDIIFAADLPKTRSGKIMRRLLRDIAEGKALGDTTTLADPAVVARLKEQYDQDDARERATFGFASMNVTSRRVRLYETSSPCPSWSWSWPQRCHDRRRAEVFEPAMIGLVPA